MKCVYVSMVSSLLLVLVASLAGTAAEPVRIAVTHYADSVVVYVNDLDLLRRDQLGLAATLQLLPGGRPIHVDLSAAWQTPAVVLEKPANARCRELALTVRAKGGELLKHTFPLGDAVRPKPAFKLTKDLLNIEPPAGDKGAAEKAADTIIPLTAAEADKARGIEAIGKFAEFETEEEVASGLPKVFLPDLSNVPAVTLRAAERVIPLKSTVHSVHCDTNYPMVGSGHVATTRQTAHPEDPEKKSFYISLKQQIYDPETRDLLRWEKFLAELPLDPAWLEGDGDITVGISNDRLRLHRTREVYRRGKYKAHMLGESMGGLSQLVYSLCVDDDGNIYFSGVPCGIAKFNVHTAAFEQPPVDFNEAIKIRRVAYGIEIVNRSDSRLYEKLNNFWPHIGNPHRWEYQGKRSGFAVGDSGAKQLDFLFAKTGQSD